jgi:hypothetical protein
MIIILLNVKDNSKGRMNEYNEDQGQSQCKDYFIVWKETLWILANTHFMEGCERLDGP